MRRLDSKGNWVFSSKVKTNLTPVFPDKQLKKDRAKTLFFKQTHKSFELSSPYFVGVKVKDKNESHRFVSSIISGSTQHSSASGLDLNSTSLLERGIHFSINAQITHDFYESPFHS